MRNGISIQSDPVSGPVEPPAPPATYAGGNPDAAPSAAVVPAWVAFDRKVLRYYLFFKESVNESRIENYRIRALTLFYYLEDDSMHISEPKVENSGMVQGERKGAVFLKRHRAPKPEGGFFGRARPSASARRGARRFRATHRRWPAYNCRGSSGH